MNVGRVMHSSGKMSSQMQQMDLQQRMPNGPGVHMEWQAKMIQQQKVRSFFHCFLLYAYC